MTLRDTSGQITFDPNSNSLNLYYSSPAKEWIEALPLGNGSIGAMVFGKTNTEKICMNIDTLWTGFPRDTRIKENTYENFLKARELSLKGKYDESQDIIEEECLGNWTQAYLPLCDIDIKFDTKFDIIVSNPPYITEDEMGILSEEVVKHEPEMALWGGIDGLYFYREIIRQSPKYLESGGMLFFEIGYWQGDLAKKFREDFGESL